MFYKIFWMIDLFNGESNQGLGLAGALRAPQQFYKFGRGRQIKETIYIEIYNDI